MWKSVEQTWYVTPSTLIAGMTNVKLTSLGLCTVRTNCILRDSSCPKKRFVLLKRHEKKFPILLDMSSVLEDILQDKNVSMSMHGTRMVKTVTNVFNVQPAGKFWLFFMRAANKTLQRLVVMAPIALPKTSRHYEIETPPPFFEDIHTLITTSQPEPKLKKAKFIPFMAQACGPPIGWYS